MPEERAAAGAAIVRGKLYVVGGVTAGASGGRALARTALVYDIARRRWCSLPGRLRASTSASRPSVGTSTRSADDSPARTRTCGCSSPMSRGRGSGGACNRSPSGEAAPRWPALDAGSSPRAEKRRGHDPHGLPLRRPRAALVAAPEPADASPRVGRGRVRRQGLRARRRDDARARGQLGERVSGDSIARLVTVRWPPVS